MCCGVDGRTAQMARRCARGCEGYMRMQRMDWAKSAYLEDLWGEHLGQLLGLANVFLGGLDVG